MGGCPIFLPISGYLTYFYTNVAGLSAGIIGTILFVSKILDGVSDIIFGNMIDKTRTKMPYFAPGASVINISSSRDRMSRPQTESYTAAKGGISALTHAMAISLAGKVRVNSISPGWIDTYDSNITGADALQQPVGRVGKHEDIAELALFLSLNKQHQVRHCVLPQSLR